MPARACATRSTAENFSRPFTSFHILSHPVFQSAVLADPCRSLHVLAGAGPERGCPSRSSNDGTGGWKTPEAPFDLGAAPAGTAALRAVTWRDASVKQSGWRQFAARRPPQKLDALPASEFDQVRIDGEPDHAFGPTFAERVVRGHD